MIKVLKDGYDLSAVGNVDAPLLKVIAQATHFISACYGMKESRDMSHTRLLVWEKQADLSAKKRSADKFDSFDPSYCQFLIKL